MKKLYCLSALAAVCLFGGCTGKTTIITVDENSTVYIEGMEVVTETDQTTDGQVDATPLP